MTDTYDSIAEVIAAHGYLADPDDAPRVAHVIRECLVPHITAALGDGELTTRPQNAEPKAMSDARELAKRFDTIWEILMDWLNDHPRICQRSSVEDLRSLCDTLVAFAQTVARAAITKAQKGVADVANMDPNRDNVRRAQHGTD